MSVTKGIVASWRRPRDVVRGVLARGETEAFAFSLLVTFLVLAFVAQWPQAARQAHLTETPLPPLLLGRALALLATIPLWYGLAALGHGVARVFGGQGTWRGARLALFWALVAVSPLMLLHGLVLGMVGAGVQATAMGLVVAAGFLFQWINALIVAEGRGRAVE
ncbi:MAG: YIP1 family protein [Gemmobacter sp.]|uniref:YIP1 family protein n=1 Tax=Gemmobacter sp. TaxID=1898957 RepID=UPI00391B9782